ncbi:hypothetical protein KGF56_001263 [Candida oxycetoniae]|uniref:Uncharacterized protein n=1 Tax=Candida oxycetoniae TaxID=497107 RepID=A0AAI9T0C2_9ASCO|nr:uncharacterized protein KGF56_001263 [Candida oxycetoniae]KAI3406044.2 hypothetical protein KGF56_001263 [Candida oxycetoniae]
MSRLNIPGHYFDEERGRYFKVVNGAIPSSSEGELKYHNNSIQAEKRIKHYDKRERDGLQGSSYKNKKSRNEELIKNPNIKNPLRKDQSRLRKFQFDNVSFLNLKTGTIDYSNDYYKEDQTDLLRAGFAHRKSKIIIPQCIIAAYHRGSFIINRLSQSTELDFSQAMKMAVFDSLRETYQQPSQVCYYRGDDGIVKLDSRSMHDVFKIECYGTNSLIIVGDLDYQLDILQLYEFSRTHQICIPRYHRFDEIKGEFEDLTVDFMKFLKKNLNKHPRGKDLERAFGFHNVEFPNYLKIGVEEVNEKLNDKQNDPVGANRHLHSFLDYHDSARPEMVYIKDPVPLLAREYPKIVAGISKSKHIYLLSSKGDLICFKHQANSMPNQQKLTMNFSNFSNFKLIDTNISVPENITLQVLESAKSSVVFFNTRVNIFSVVVETGQVSTYSMGFVRKFFIINENKLLVVRKNDIVFFNTVSKTYEKIADYNNCNNGYQQFEVIQNHFIYNVGQKFTVYNLKRGSGDRDATTKINFSFLKYGFFKDFYLIKIIDMGTENGRMHLGFQHMNKEKDQTLFEAYTL